MEGNTKGSGKTTECMGKDFINGKMEDAIKEITTWIKSKVAEYIIGQMEGNMMASGIMENSKDKVDMCFLTEQAELEYGNKVKELNG